MVTYSLVDAYAELAHSTQVRKYTGEPYIEHPRQVAENVAILMRSLGAPEEEVELAMCVAVLHDVVEDTAVNIEEINEDLGSDIAQGVWFLTDPETFVGNRAERKSLTRDRLRNAPRYVKMIKVCDINHNRGSIAEHDLPFLTTFDRETNALIEAMGE